MRFEAVIFDLDGTLPDSMDVWEQIDICFLQKRGLSVPADYVAEICARSFEEAAQRLGAAPQHCLIFENVLPAVKSAKQAGMMVCAAYDKYSARYRVQMEQEAAGKIIGKYIVEMNSEPETEKIETKFVAQISLENETWELFYPFVQEGKETLLPLREYAEENWFENAEKWMQEGADV